MHSKGFHRMFLQSILVAFLCCVSTADDYRCPYNIHVNKGQIIKARESVSNGASFLKHSPVYDAKECYKLCCERKTCDLAQMQYKNSTDGFFARVEKICYMFHCGKPSKCRFGEHDHYATISYERPDEELSHLDSNQYAPVKVAKPKWGVQESEYKPSIPVGDKEEKDLGRQPSKPSVTQHVKEQEQYQESKDLSNSWKPKSEEESSEYTKKVKQFGEPRYHSKDTKEPTAVWEKEESSKPEETEQTFYQEVVTKKHETPTKHFQVETKGPIVSVEKITEKQINVQPTEQEDLDDADAELERKLEELTPSNNRQAEHAGTDVKPVPTKPPTTFHQWRHFVDNNPNFPYTIPVKELEKPTVKPTTEKWREPSTEPTTKKKIPTVFWKIPTVPTVRTEPHKMTEKKVMKTITTEKAKAHDEVANTKAPILEVPIQNKNISDVVVIETHRLRIIENKAVLPLAIFLVLAILLLFVVALRLRIVKSKLKRRPFATDDADYLINGMYL
ncbi:uncharacterized protein LOC144630988 [Oculina patagonica]